MKVLLVYANPNEASLGAAVRIRAETALRRSGHQLHVVDLYADGFDPRVSDAERRAHHAPDATRPEIDGYAERLRWCDALVLVYPTWWSAQPAILKGWFDRVFTSDIAYALPEADALPGQRRPTPLLRSIRRLVVVTTHGSPKRINMVEGEAGKRIVFRSLRSVCSRRVRCDWIALYNVDRATAKQRDAFLERVDRRLSRLR